MKPVLSISTALSVNSTEGLAEVLGIRLILTAWLVAVAAWDWRRAIIPNLLTLPVMLAAGGVRLYQGHLHVLAIWVLLYLIWRVNIVGGGDAKLLMGLFALFPTYEFALLFSILMLAVSVPLIIARHWGKRPSDLAAAVADRIGRGRFLPTREELEVKGQQYAWTFCLPGLVYLWRFW
jgi:Flp pilus assembly protein protease CpaA